MGLKYCQLVLSERIEIYRLRSGGWSFPRIAAYLGRDASTISREWNRNSKKTKSWRGGYRAERAERLARRRRRWDCRFKLARQPELRAQVRDRLAMGWSPEQIAGRLALEDAPMKISHESIYRFIYHRVGQKDYWNRFLTKAKGRRGRPGRKGGSPVDKIKHRLPLSERPAEVESRRMPGHWEADLMLFATYGQVILVAHERCSRYLRASQQPSKAAQPVIASLLKMLRPLPQRLRQTMTFDNGTEFAYHYQLHEGLGLKTYFCDAYSPWQKGGVENAISRLRRRLPRKTDLAGLKPGALAEYVEGYNNTPRKCLGYQTPNEVFRKCQTDALQS
jgi:IS30 family transposase